MQIKRIMKFPGHVLLITSAIALLAACSSVPKFTSEKAKTEIDTTRLVMPDTAQYANLSESLETVIGVASYYAHEFDGKQTSNGEIYNMYGLTAAHHSYPFGTIIRVTNMSNGKHVMVRVNDRMPKHPARIIDLSYGTAIQLDMINDGLVKVKLDILQWGDG